MRSGNARSRTMVLVALSCLVFCVGQPASAQSTPPAGDGTAVKQILDLAGVRQGLCVHLGCGREASATLTADLAAGSGLLVHGLALDDVSLQRARKAIEARGVAGRATVERAPLNPLPYLNDLARVVVVEDFAALAAVGVTREEILRTIAPNGTLLMREKGAWTRTVKPMPKEMDEWTHPQHGPDGNKVSTDSALKSPIGLRWQDGLPVVMSFRAGTGSWVAAGGKLFTAGVNELENLSTSSTVVPNYSDLHGQTFAGYPQYLTARDAFSGIPLWKINLGSLYEGGAGNWQNSLPLAATGRRVYAAGKERIVVADAASGEILVECRTKYTPVRMLLLDHVLVAAGWEGMIRKDQEWAWLPQVGKAVAAGSVEAFDADTGEPIWALQTTVFKIVASDGVIFMETFGGDPPAASGIVVIELRTGKERWRVSREKLGCAGEFSLGTAGGGCVTALKVKEKSLAVLSAADGSERFQVPCQTNWAPLVDGLLWLGGKMYDTQTGAIKGPMPTYLSGDGCQQSSLTPNFVINNYGFHEIPDPKKKPPAPPSNARGFRPACVMSWVPAYGMGYTAANPCRCLPGAAYGFIAVGPSGGPPTPADFEKPRPTEKGSAFGPVAPATPETSDWPMFRHDPQRSASTPARLPEGLKELWRTPVATAGQDILTNAWRSLATPLISAPVAQGGLVFVSAADVGQVIAMDAATGKPAWTATLGSRLTGPPTLHRGLCVIGCHDGWVYALRAKDGVLAWRTRLAPLERRMVAFGRVESVWPAAGAVLLHNDVLYATAGRTCEAEGGVAMAALDPATGAMLWGKVIAPGPQRVNDCLAVRHGLLAWHYVRFDPKDGRQVAPDKFETNLTETMPLLNPLQGPMLDAAWTVIPAHRRAGSAYMVGDLYASQLAWTEKTVVSPRGGLPCDKAQAAGKHLPADDKTWKYDWRSGLTQDQRIEALVMTADAAVYAGRTTEPKTRKVTAFFWVVSLASGGKIAEFPLECPPACDGLAVAEERVFLSLTNGQVLCFAK
jgi:outer membrane protein assembly factor BamB